VARGNDARVGVPFDFFGSPSPRRRQDRELRLVALPFDRQGTAWGVEARASRLATDLAFGDPDDPFAAGSTDAESRAARAVATWRRSDRLWIAFGADWERQEATSVDAFSRVEGVHQATRAGFVEVHLRAGRASLDAGLRRDDNDAFGAETSARLGAVVALGGDARLRASYGEAFRPPTLVDLYFPGFGNPDLGPETSRSWEAGFEGEAGRWSFELVGFANDQENLIVFDLATFLPQNVGRARARGAEATVGLSAGPFRGRLAAAWLDAENRATGERLVRRPRRSASVVATWAPAGWTVNGVARYVGDRVDVGGVPLGGYAAVDLAAAWRVRPRLEPYARLENALDRRYAEAAGFPAPGRALVGGVALRF
jgi:vitamin B12 transporter